MKLSILGTEYDFEAVHRTDDVQLVDSDGIADFNAKTIRVAIDFLENDPGITRALYAYKSKVKRHEIAHTFLYESGMQEWADDEKLVEWIAIQFPKMLEAFKEVDAI